MTPSIQVIAQQPPGGRCTFYAGYADVLDRAPVQHVDGVILMPSDILAALSVLGVAGEAALGLAEAQEAPLERMLEDAV